LTKAGAGQDGQGDGSGMGTTLGRKAAADLLDRVKAVPETCEQLQRVNAALATMFTDHYGPNAILEKHEVPAAYQRFFVQVSCAQSNPTVFLITGLDRRRGICPPNDNAARTQRPRRLQ
jgi:hypothetical protein